jgi:UDP-N-acetylmuramate--alanine ligase
MDIHFEDNSKLIPSFFFNTEQTLVIYTPAIPAGHEELNYFRENGFKVKKRSEVLGMLTENYFTIAVAGTHGKTTTSSIAAHIMNNAEGGCTAFLGGIAVNYNSNLLLSLVSNKMVVEADEYDRSFLTLNPDVAIVTSTDPDHLDIYGTKENMEKNYHEFVSKIKETGTLIYKSGLAFAEAGKKSFTYSLKGKSDFGIENLTVENGEYTFDIISPIEKIESVKFCFPGIHNLENALAAAAAAQVSGIDKEVIKKALATYKGVKRRFEYIIKNEKLVFIDDYAHHPRELSACISSVKALYPEKKITGIFQPHLFSRTRDFADGFAKSLDLLDEVILLEIYPARELPIDGVDSKMLLDKITVKNKSLLSKDGTVNEVAERKLEVLLTLGAGDIDKLVDPIKKKLLSLTT